MSLNMLKVEPSKGSIPAKQEHAWMKTPYLEAILIAGLRSMADDF